LISIPTLDRSRRCEARVVWVDEEMVVDHLHAGGVTDGAENRFLFIPRFDRSRQGHVSFFDTHSDPIGFAVGAPGVFDRLLATRFGAAATEHLARGEHGVLVGLIKGEIAATPLNEVVANRKPLDPGLFELARALAK